MKNPRSSCWRRSQACRLPVDDQVFVVRSSRLSQDDQQSSGISSSCGETKMYQWDSLSFPPQVLDAVLSFESLATVFCAPVRSKFELFALSVPGLWDALEPSAVGDRSTVFDTTFNIGFGFATTRSSSPGLSCCMSLFDMVWEELGWADMPRWKNWDVHDVEETEKVVSFTTGEVARCQDVGKLVLLYQHLWFGFVDPSLFCRVTNRARLLWVLETCKASSLYDHLDYCFVVFKNIKQGFEFRKFCVWSDVINFCPAKILWRVRLYLRSFVGVFFTVLWVDSKKNETLQWHNPRDQEREYHPCVNLHQEK